MNRISIIAVAMLITCTSCSENIKDSYWQGKIKRETMTLASKVPGRVVERRVEDGDFVQTGDTLLVLYIPEVEAKMTQAKGAWLVASSKLDNWACSHVLFSNSFPSGLSTLYDRINSYWPGTMHSHGNSLE